MPDDFAADAAAARASGPRAVHRISSPPDATVRVPGSKSITNRALVCAALADGTSTLGGALLADDSDAMVACLTELGVRIRVHEAKPADLADPVPVVTLEVHGVGGRFRAPTGPLSAGLSGTTARFLAPLLAAAQVPSTLDAEPEMRRRPMGPLVGALRELGADVQEDGEPDHLPLTFAGSGLPGGHVSVPAEASSQFASGLLLAGPSMHDEGLRLDVAANAASRPYIDMTAAVMRSFFARVDTDPPAGRMRTAFLVKPGSYEATHLTVEPDASAASYFFAVAALTGGRVRVEGLGHDSLQGDVGFVEVLGEMGAAVEHTDAAVEVRGTGRLRGIDVDLSDMPDVAQTLAAVAVFADGPTRVTGIEVVRGHETDRIRAVVTELRRCGLEADEHDDGFTVHPGAPRPTVVQTYRDHRMAMSFALLGLVAPGIEIADSHVVAKTFPQFWDVLDGLAAGPRGPGE